MNDNKIVLSRRLRQLRHENGLLQSEIAGLLHMSQPAYSRYESGKREIPVEVLRILAAFYCVSSDYLLGIENGSFID